MAYIKCNDQQELRKYARGKKTKVPVEILIHDALDHNPDAQAAAAKLFGIKGYAVCPGTKRK
jgi:hypothetical protein